jgi:hypothetical protein
LRVIPSPAPIIERVATHSDADNVSLGSADQHGVVTRLYGGAVEVQISDYDMIRVVNLDRAHSGTLSTVTDDRPVLRV